MNQSKCEVTWNNLQLTSKEQKKIISNASGQIRPSTLTALLGPSGSGKSSLLNSIAGRIGSDQILTGDIQVNGQNRDEENWPRTVAYLGQKFYAYEWETVYETLEFGARLKLTDQNQVEAKVKEVIEVLNLTSARNTFIGKLSGGERIRVGLGLELLGDPLVILVDEPLSGLDSYNAINILEILRKIANRGQTVMVTIHQPSYIMMSYFDSIMLMCQGSCVYEGTLNNCIKFFEECGFELPKNTTPTDFFLDILSINNQNEDTKADSLKRIQTVAREWNFIRTEHEFQIRNQIALPPVKPMVSNFKILLLRNTRNYLRNVHYLRSKILQKVFTAILFGITFFNTGLENADVFTFRGIMASTLHTEIFGVSSPIMGSFIEEKKIVSRECMSGMYRGYEAYLTKFLSESLLNFMYAVPYHLTIYYLVGFPFDLKVLATFFLIIFFIINYSVALGLTIGTIAKSTPSAQILGATINVSVLLYSGVHSNLHSISKYTSWICWISPCHYAFRALVRNQLSYLPSTTDAEFTKVSNPQTIFNFGLEGLGVSGSLIRLFLITLGVQLLGAYLLQLKTNNNMKIKKLKGSTV